MKKKHLYGAMLWAFLVTANLCTGCSDDNDYPDVDGQNPTMTLATDHIESGAGHRFTIEDIRRQRRYCFYQPTMCRPAFEQDN